MFRLPAEIRFSFLLHISRWVFEITDSKKTPCFIKSDSDHIWRWFKIWLQLYFYKCVLVWMLWLLKADFNLSFASLLTRHNDNVKTLWQKYSYSIQTVCPKVSATTTAQNITIYTRLRGYTCLRVFLVQLSSSPWLDRALIWRTRWCTWAIPCKCQHYHKTFFFFTTNLFKLCI